MRTPTRPALVALTVALSPVVADLHLAAQTPDEHAAVLAVAEEALEAVTREDWASFAALLLPEGMTFSARADENGPRYSARTREYYRELIDPEDIVERGFDARVLVSGPVALVWMPYDLYVEGAWSHCGVDTFTMILTGDGWRIAGMAWTVEQPPACTAHPDGPPGG
ncbi:MAG: nuclear transport factor 2 family protein [Gemmatimonadota bacterium]|nr:nuclear transport factor 2 family protein [Gemmatimonadota bacterium]